MTFKDGDIVWTFFRPARITGFNGKMNGYNVVFLDEPRNEYSLMSLFGVREDYMRKLSPVEQVLYDL